MPGFPGVSGYIFFSPGISKDKSIYRSVVFQKFIFPGFGEILGQVKFRSRTGDVQGQTGLVFATSGRGHIGTAAVLVNFFLTGIGTESGDSPE